MARDYGLSPGGGVGSMMPGHVVSQTINNPPPIPTGPMPGMDSGGMGGGPDMSAARRRQNRLYAKAQRLLRNQGRTAIRGAQADMTQDIARSTQGLVDRGLGNTTIVNAEQRGIKADARSRIQSIREGAAGQRANVYMQQAGGALSLDSQGINNASNMQMEYIRLLQQLGAAGGSL